MHNVEKMKSPSWLFEDTSEFNFFYTDVIECVRMQMCVMRQFQKSDVLGYLMKA